jgi:NADPH:quinone reductase-like Zn-dependent oxidoreductase
MNVEDLIPVVLRHLEEQVVPQKPRVIDQDVDAPEPVRDLLERRPDLLGTPSELMKKNHVVAGFYLPNIMSRPKLFAPSLEKILGWISSGDLKLTIGARYPLEQAQEAHDALEGRKTTGKIVLNP